MHRASTDLQLKNQLQMKELEKSKSALVSMQAQQDKMADMITNQQDQLKLKADINLQQQKQAEIHIELMEALQQDLNDAKTQIAQNNHQLKMSNHTLNEKIKQHLRVENDLKSKEKQLERVQ